jgi:hypothetical protein
VASTLLCSDVPQEAADVGAGVGAGAGAATGGGVGVGVAWRTAEVRVVGHPMIDRVNPAAVRMGSVRPVARDVREEENDVMWRCPVGADRHTASREVCRVKTARM